MPTTNSNVMQSFSHSNSAFSLTWTPDSEQSSIYHAFHRKETKKCVYWDFYTIHVISYGLWAVKIWGKCMRQYENSWANIIWHKILQLQWHGSVFVLLNFLFIYYNWFEFNATVKRDAKRQEYFVKMENTKLL